MNRKRVPSNVYIIVCNDGVDRSFFGGLPVPRLEKTLREARHLRRLRREAGVPRSGGRRPGGRRMNRPRPTGPIRFCMNHLRPAVLTYHERGNDSRWVHSPACGECVDTTMTCLICGERRVRYADDVCDACGVHQDDVTCTLPESVRRLRLRFVSKEGT